MDTLQCRNESDGYQGVQQSFFLTREPKITTFVCLLGHDQEPNARKSEKRRKLRGHNDAARDD